VGGGVRSREMSHWIVGNKPVVGNGETEFELLYALRGREESASRTPYSPERARVPDDARQLRELWGERARRVSANTRAVL
jgi:hypothetical protein